MNETGTDPQGQGGTGQDGAGQDGPRYWVATVSRAHVLRAREGGFTQVDHGRGTRLQRFAVGDRIAYYSPRTDHPVGEPLQEFTGIATVTGETCYQVRVSEDLQPWRRDVVFDSDVAPVAVRPLLERLAFVPDLSQWGLPFRRGLFAVGRADFTLIEAAMRAAARLAA